MSKLRLTSTRALVSPLGIPSPPDYTWVMIPYTDREMAARRNAQKRAHIQIVKNSKLEEPSR